MPALPILFCGSKALSLLGTDMYNDRMRSIFHHLEGRDQLAEIIAVLHKHIAEPHCPEEVAFRLAIRFPQQPKILIKAAVIFRDRHLIIIDHDNQIAAQLRCKIQPLQRLPSTERAVADHGDDILFAAL